MATSRSYNDACGMAHALDLVGERWALLVVRELILGPKRYTDLRGALGGVSTNVLAHRLDELEQAGVLRRRRVPPPAAVNVYELTAWGRELEPVITALGRWGARSPARLVDAQLSVSSVVLSLRTNFDPIAGAGTDVRCGLGFGEERFRAVVAGGAFEVARATQDGYAEVDVVVEAEPRALAGVLYGGRDLGEAVEAGDVVVEGENAQARRFLAAFTLPPPAEAG